MITGDYPAHDVWLQSREGNLAHTKKMVDLVSLTFPGVQIIPGIGNHESYPCNSYPPIDLEDPEFAISWLYPTLAQFYKNWFPEELQANFEESFAQRGYYTFKQSDDLRIIVVNPNACLGYNL